MAGLCVYLNLFSRQRDGLANLIVNVVMFVIVGIIFLKCEFNSFRPTDRMIRDLDKATDQIRTDAANAKSYLWEQYRKDHTELFAEATLQREYGDFRREMGRIGTMKNASYNCDIEDYINSDLTDAAIHRNMLNQVPGAMTGLGILGTFIGLSLGLQGFNIGSTQEITDSISPLMDGIKVAFHTSIYGMIFSLVFNYVYKRKLDNAESAVEDFLSAFRKYVLPDTMTDGINRLMEIEQQQNEAIHALADTVGVQLSDGLSKMLEPQFNRFDKTLEKFGNVATQNQLDALNRVVAAFIEEMNKSLGGSFNKLSEAITNAYLLQRNTANQMTEILDRTGSATANLQEIDRQTASIINALNIYTSNVESAQAEIERGAEAVRRQADDNGQFLTDLNASRLQLNATAEALGARLQTQADLLQQLRGTVIQMPERVQDTFHVIDRNLVDVETHLYNTVAQIKSSTDAVPVMVQDAYSGIGAAFERAADAVENLADTLDRMAADPLSTEGGGGRR